MNNLIFSLGMGWAADLLIGDPEKLPHPVVWFGKMISFAEHRLNHGARRKAKGAVTAIGLILFVFAATWLLRRALLFTLPEWVTLLFDAVCIFYCLAGTRSAQAIARLRQLGYTRAENIGGIRTYKGETEKLKGCSGWHCLVCPACWPTKW